jgi:hypothetical protein
MSMTSACNDATCEMHEPCDTLQATHKIQRLHNYVCSIDALCTREKESMRVREEIDQEFRINV